MLLELCSLCPVEPACGRAQMLDHVCGREKPHASGAPDAVSFQVKGQPYRCWLLALKEKAAAVNA